MGGIPSIPADAVLPDSVGALAREVEKLRELSALADRLMKNPGLDERLRTICEFWVPSRAEWAVITLVDDHAQGLPRVAAVAHRRPELASALMTRIKGQPFSPRDRLPWTDRNAEVVLALECDTRCAGMLHLGLPDGLEIPDAEFYQAVAQRCAAALLNASAFEEQRRISVTLQSAAMATALPHVDGMRFDAIYEAAEADALVGGDWYDAFEVEDGRIVLSVGDVTGSGFKAAVAMMNVRQAIRGVAQVHPDPAVMLAAAERTLRMQHDDLLVTAFVGVIDPVTQQLSYSNAGHPPALIRMPDGAVCELNSSRPALGLSDFSPEFHVSHVAIPPGSLLLLYTDGLIEYSKDILEGEQCLRAALAAPDLIAYDNVSRRIHDVVLGQRSRDDVAILSVRTDNAKEVRRWRFDPMWEDAALRVRKELVETLPPEFDAASRTDVEVIFSELMSNIIRYADGTAEVILEEQSGQFVLHVLDKGAGFLFIPKLPPDLFSEFGRGLFLIANLCVDFSMERRPGGGSHARVVLAKSTGAVQE